jgi:hypothetical protein
VSWFTGRWNRGYWAVGRWMAVKKIATYAVRAVLSVASVARQVAASIRRVEP